MPPFLSRLDISLPCSTQDLWINGRLPMWQSISNAMASSLRKSPGILLDSNLRIPSYNSPAFVRRRILAQRPTQKKIVLNTQVDCQGYMHTCMTIQSPHHLANRATSIEYASPGDCHCLVMIPPVIRWRLN